MQFFNTYVLVLIERIKENPTSMLRSRTVACWKCHKCLVTPLFWNGFSAIISLIFRRRSKRMAFLESVNFSMCMQMCMKICKFSLLVMVTWPLFSKFTGLYLWNAWSQTLQVSKRHNFRVSAFLRYHWFWVKLFPVCCVQDSRREH